MMNKQQLRPQLYKTFDKLKDLSKGKVVCGITIQDLSMILDRKRASVSNYLRELEKLKFIKKEMEGGGNGKNEDGTPRKLILKILK